LDEDAVLEKEQSVKPDDRRMREQAIRQAVREAFIQSQAEETVKRALLGRPRTMKRMYEQDDWVPEVEERRWSSKDPRRSGRMDGARHSGWQRRRLVLGL